MDDVAFTNVDAKLFVRLHWGAPGPVTFHLRDGRTLTGDVIAIHRSGATGATHAAPGGSVRVRGGAGAADLSYDDIIDIT